MVSIGDLPVCRQVARLLWLLSDAYSQPVGSPIAEVRDRTGPKRLAKLARDLDLLAPHSAKIYGISEVHDIKRRIASVARGQGVIP